jgi:hypothetical protein
VPVHAALVPLLTAVTHVAAEPSQVLPLLAELQAPRQLPPPPELPPGAAPPPQPSPPRDPGFGPSASGSAAAPSYGVASDAEVCDGLGALHACLCGRVAHRGAVRSAAVMAAGLAWGAGRAGPGALAAARGVLGGCGALDCLVALLRGSALDIRKEAAAALATLCGGTSGGGGSTPRAAGGQAHGEAHVAAQVRCCTWRAGLAGRPGTARHELGLGCSPRVARGRRTTVRHQP